MAIWYVGSTKYSAVTQWAASTAYSVGDLRRQLASPTVGNERVFRCTTAGTSGGTEPTWVLTTGGTTNDGTAVWTEVTGNSTYGWTAAIARVRVALSKAAAGDTIYVSNNHAATEAATVNWASPGTAASPVVIQCVDDSATPPTATATTATEATTGASHFGFQGMAICRGVSIACGTGASVADLRFNSSTAAWWRMEGCALSLGCSSTNARIYIGSDTASQCNGVEWVNVTVQFANASQNIAANVPFRWRNTASAIQGATLPTVLFVGNAAAQSSATEVEGVDLSALGSGKSIVNIGTNSYGRWRFIDCKLGSSVSPTTGSVTAQSGRQVEFINCDSADTNYRFYRQNYAATEQQETTIVRSGGASDGTTAVSRKISSTANSKWFAPYESMPIEYWNEAVGGSLTATVPVVTDGVTLTDAEAWVEVEYLGTSGFPLGSFASDRISDPVFGTPANQATDGVSSWATTGLASPVTQTLSVSFTPQEKGLIRARVCLAKPSTTVYYDPLLQVA